MPNMSLKRNEMPAQDPKERARNFKEVTLGYSMEIALDEARRCLNCPKPRCVEGCPVNINIPGFIMKLSNKDLDGSYGVLAEASSLSAICGRVCPQEKQCEERCIRTLRGESVAIGRLERFVADYHREFGKNKPIKTPYNGHKVAIIGAGPSGLTCAGDLAKLGYKVTIFEALHVAGGVLVYGIPEFRLPKAIVQKQVDELKNLGVEINCNMVIGKVLSIDELFEDGYESIFVGTGAGLPNFMGIPGENLKGVYSANEFLTRINLMKAYQDDPDTPVWKAKNVAVIGGGNVAMDAARCAMRLGAEHVYIVYRRSLEELPARKEEVEHAMEEGIDFRLLNNPVKIIGDETLSVKAMIVEKMELGEPDASGRRKPIKIPGSEFILDVDVVVEAIGTSPNPLIKNTTKGLDVNNHGCFITKDESGLTSRVGVYAGGDAVTGAATVILAMGAGKQAAKAIDQYIKSK